MYFTLYPLADLSLPFAYLPPSPHAPTLFQHHHFPGLHVGPGLQPVEVNSPGQIRGVELNRVET